MKYIVKMNELNDFSKYLKKFCYDELYSSFCNLEKKLNSIEWEGKAKDVYFSELIRRINYMKENINKLYFYAYFYKYASNHFTEANTLSNAEFTKFYNEFNIVLEEMVKLYE